MENGNSKPIAKFSSGQIHVAVWENSSRQGEAYNTVTVEKRYKVGEEWRSSKSFRPNELPKLIFALQQANSHFSADENPESKTRE